MCLRLSFFGGRRQKVAFGAKKALDFFPMYAIISKSSVEKLICECAGIGRQASLRCLCSTGRVGSSPITRTTFLFRLWERNFGYARVVELADSLDSGSSAHYGRAGSSPASRTNSDTNFDTMGIRLVSDFFAPWGGRFCMSRHSVFSHAVRWRSARDH